MSECPPLNLHLRYPLRLAKTPLLFGLLVCWASVVHLINSGPEGSGPPVRSHHKGPRIGTKGRGEVNTGSCYRCLCPDVRTTTRRADDEPAIAQVSPCRLAAPRALNTPKHDLTSNLNPGLLTLTLSLHPCIPQVGSDPDGPLRCPVQPRPSSTRPPPTPGADVLQVGQL